MREEKIVFYERESTQLVFKKMRENQSKKKIKVRTLDEKRRKMLSKSGIYRG